jgi:hypothetical protein
MNGFIYGLPEYKEIGPQSGQCSERTSITCVCEHFDLASADVVVLFHTPLHSDVAIVSVAPSDGCLFFNELVVVMGKSGKVECRAFKARVQACNENIQQVLVVQLVRFVRFAPMHEKGVAPILVG